MSHKSKGFPALNCTAKGEVKAIHLSAANPAEGVKISDVQKILKKKSEPTYIGNYRYKHQYLHFFGYTEGKKGTENKHELPPPHNTETLFGDILVLVSETEDDFRQTLPFSPEEYENFYTAAFGGGEEDDESEEEDGEEEAEEAAEEAAVDELAGEELDDGEKGVEKGDLEEDDAEEGEEDLEAEDGEEVEDAEEEGAGEEADDGMDDEGPSRPSRNRSRRKKGPDQTRALLQRRWAQSTLLLENLKKYGDDLRTEVNSDKVSPYRETAIQQLTAYFGTLLTRPEVVQLETAIYNRCLVEAQERHIVRDWRNKLFLFYYQQKVKHMAANLHSCSYIGNSGLLERYKRGEFTFEDLLTWTDTELFPERNRDLADRQFQREQRLLEGNKAMATDQFYCSRCHKRQCTYYEMQTRSADEPMTIFIQCVNCGKRWRQ